MSSSRVATALRAPPCTCCVCLEPQVSEPGWQGDDVLVCMRCCSATRSLIRRGDAGRVADVWFLGRALVDRAWEHAAKPDAVAETHLDLAVAYSEMGLDTDALLEALVAVRCGDDGTWSRLTTFVLGAHVVNPAFVEALRRAPPRPPFD